MPVQRLEASAPQPESLRQQLAHSGATCQPRRDLPSSYVDWETPPQPKPLTWLPSVDARPGQVKAGRLARAALRNQGLLGTPATPSPAAQGVLAKTETTTMTTEWVTETRLRAMTEVTATDSVNSLFAQQAVEVRQVVREVQQVTRTLSTLRENAEVTVPETIPEASSPWEVFLLVSCD